LTSPLDQIASSCWRSAPRKIPTTCRTAPSGCGQPDKMTLLRVVFALLFMAGTVSCQDEEKRDRAQRDEAERALMSDPIRADSELRRRLAERVT
jgi:hypothetical protein